MIKGAKYADRDIYSQENNPIDVYNRKAHPGGGWLESCGPSALINCCSAVSNREIKAEVNGIPLQPEQAVWDIMNDFNYYNEMLTYRDGITYEQLEKEMIPSRIPQFYVWAAMKLFKIKSEFHWNYTKEPFKVITDLIDQGNSVQLQLVSPAHYISCSKHDTEKDLILYDDSWFSRWSDKSGKDRVLTKEEFLKNTQRFYNVYFPPEGV